MQIVSAWNVEAYFLWKIEKKKKKKKYVVYWKFYQECLVLTNGNITKTYL